MPTNPNVSGLNKKKKSLLTVKANSKAPVGGSVLTGPTKG